MRSYSFAVFVFGFFLGNFASADAFDNHFVPHEGLYKIKFVMSCDPAYARTCNTASFIRIGNIGGTAYAYELSRSGQVINKFTMNAFKKSEFETAYFYGHGDPTSSIGEGATWFYEKYKQVDSCYWFTSHYVNLERYEAGFHMPKGEFIFDVANSQGFTSEECGGSTTVDRTYYVKKLK
jgi:hypothetical protein